MPRLVAESYFLGSRPRPPVVCANPPVDLEIFVGFAVVCPQEGRDFAVRSDGYTLIPIEDAPCRILSRGHWLAPRFPSSLE